MYDITGRIIEFSLKKVNVCGEYVSLTWRSA